MDDIFVKICFIFNYAYDVYLGSGMYLPVEVPHRPEESIPMELNS